MIGNIDYSFSKITNIKGNLCFQILKIAFSDNLKQVMRFPRIGDEDDTFLHTDLSEQLLERLCLKGTENKPITDLNLTLFHPHNTRLRAVRLTNVSRLTLDGLRVLREHNINELEIRGLSNATISDVVGQCLGKKGKKLSINTFSISNLINP